MPEEGPLAGVRVVGVGNGIGVAYATKVLADLGAGATNVEVTGLGPSSGRLAGTVDDLRFHYLQHRCRSQRFDLRADGEKLRAEVARADIVILELAPGLWEKTIATEPGAATARAPVLVRLSPFGVTGPRADRKASDLTLQAMAGWSSRLAEPGESPVFVGGDVAEYAGGIHAAVAALTAWRHARDIDDCVEVDVSTFECLVGMLPYPTVHAEILEAAGIPIPHFTRSLPGVIACADGWVGVNPLNVQGWNDMCAVIGLPEFHDRLREAQADDAASAAFRSLATPWFLEREVDSVVELFQALRIPTSRVVDGDGLLRHPQLVARSAFTNSPELGFSVPRPPWRFSTGAAAPVAATPTPSWGGGRAGLPYSGLKVVDLTIYWAGPIVTMFLAAFGADVLKVESRARPDPFRYSTSSPELGDDWWERSAVWQATNLDKRSLTLDLTHPDGQRLARRLITEADVLIENFSPRVLAHLGLNVETLRAANPGLIVVRMPAFGLDGPFRDHVAWAPTFEQASGMAHVSGRADGRPVPPGGCADPFAGMHGLLALQAALEQRDRTGAGVAIEMAQLESLLGITAAQVIAASSGVAVPGRIGNRHPELSPHGIYPCAAGEWVAIAVHDNEWRGLADALGYPTLADDRRLATAAGRRGADDELDGIITGWTAQRSAAEAETSLLLAGVTAGRGALAATLRDDEQLRARKYFQAIHRPATATYHYPGWPMRFSFGPATPHDRPAPTLGEHTDRILREVLGLTPDELRELHEQGVT